MDSTAIRWYGRKTAACGFSFKHAPGSQSLAGKRIVIDPGHGGSHVGTAAGNVTEKSMTLKYALALRDKLESLGATVTLTRTGDSHLASDDHDDLVARADMARNNGTDLFISLHMDGSTSSTANGSSVHYFNEYSYEASVKVAAQMQAVYDSYNPGGQKRGAVGSLPGHADTRLPRHAGGVRLFDHPLQPGAADQRQLYERPSCRHCFRYPGLFPKSAGIPNSVGRFFGPASGRDGGPAGRTAV